VDEAIALLAAELGAVELRPCSGCGVPVPVTARGHGALCLRCTERELNISYESNAARINNRRALGSWINAEVPRREWIPRYSVSRRRAAGYR
jgi:hypothetical protein